MTTSPLAVARACLKAYVDKDREAIETLLAEDFRFTSPIDNRLDRATYLARCWPNSETTDSFEEVYAVEFGDRALVTYEACARKHRFRNTEVMTVFAGKLVAIEVYFGWNLPHAASENGFIDAEG